MSHETKGVNELLTSNFILIVLGRLQQRAGKAVPWQLFPYLGQHVVGDEAHKADQCIEHILESRLKETRVQGVRSPHQAHCRLLGSLVPFFHSIMESSSQNLKTTA